MKSFYSFFFLIVFSLPSFARFEWVVISRGSYQGSGFAYNKWDAVDRCAADALAQYVRLAQSCCNSTQTDASAAYGNRCAGGYSGPQNNRSFDGGLAAYFCWPNNIAQQMATGYWLIRSTVRPWSCSELQDLSAPAPAPTPTPVAPASALVPLATTTLETNLLR